MEAATPASDITHSVAHYLMTVDELNDKQASCRAADIARALGVSRNAVSLKLQALLNSELVSIDAKRNITLTDNGHREVDVIVSTRRSVKHLLVDLLGIDANTAEHDACLVEHLLSRQTGVQLLKMFQFLKQGQPAAQQFIAEFKEFSHNCDGDDDGCAICHHQCLLSDQIS